MSILVPTIEWLDLHRDSCRQWLSFQIRVPDIFYWFPVDGKWSLSDQLLLLR